MAEVRSRLKRRARAGFAVFVVVIITLLVFIFLDEWSRASISAWLPEVSLKREPSVQIVFAGDAMFDRTVRTKAQKSGYTFLLESLRPIFDAHDMVLINIEGPITSSISLSQYTGVGDLFNTRFTFDPAVATMLSLMGVTAHVGNNHIWDFGREGIEETKRHLNAEGVAFFGDSNGASNQTLVTELEGIKIGLVSYNEFAGGSDVRALASIRSLASSTDVQILYAHWGQEYENIPTPTQVLLARRFVDAGADLVVGSHPHVVQVHEVYKNAPIYYSLGNLVFDQYWEPAVRCGAMLSVEIKDGVVTSEKLIPVRMEKTRQTVIGECI